MTLHCTERGTARPTGRIIATIRCLQRLLEKESGEAIFPKIYRGVAGQAEREKWLDEWAKELAHLRACRAHADGVVRNVAITLAVLNTGGIYRIFQDDIHIPDFPMPPPVTRTEVLGRLMTALKAIDVVNGAQPGALANNFFPRALRSVRERLQKTFEDEKLAEVCKVMKFSHILKDKSIKIWEPQWDQEEVDAEAPLVFGPTPDKKEQEDWGSLLEEVEERSEKTGGVPYP